MTGFYLLNEQSVTNNAVYVANQNLFKVCCYKVTERFLR